MNVDVEPSAPLEADPLTGFAPLHPFDAVQLAALVELHVSVEDSPEDTAPGLAERETVGAGGVTATLAVAAVVPPLPVQFSTNVDPAVSGPVDAEPLVALVPLQSPDAVQLVALAEVQLSVEAWPELTVPGVAEIETVGALAWVTETEADACDVPPSPVQEIANVVVVASAPVDSVPLTALAPFQPPEARQLVALLELHVRVEEPPEVTVPGVAEMETTGAGEATVTVAEFCTVPPLPVHASVKVVVAVNVVVVAVPLADLAPLQPPEAVQLVALVELQDNVEVPSEFTVPGFAVRVRVGAAGWITETASLACAEPPGPVQVSRNVVAAVRAAVDWVPLSGLLPLHPAEAVQLVAFVEDQVSVAVPPGLTLAGLTENDMVGGAAAALTVTTVLAWDVPPVPEQLRKNDVVADKGPTGCVPLVACVPLQPPDAVQLVAPFVVQDSDDAPPVATDAGLADMDMVGATFGCTVTTAVPVAVPPAPLQFKENEEPVFNAPVDCVPLVGLAPLQPPEAVHSLVPVEDHVSVDASPSATALGLAVMVTVGAETLTFTDVVADALPPVPEQISVNTLLPAPSVPVTSVPEVDLLPDQAPDAVHEEARADCQLRVVVPGAERLAGLADRVTVGGSFVTPWLVSVPSSPPPQPASMSSETQDRARRRDARARGMERASRRGEIIGI